MGQSVVAVFTLTLTLPLTLTFTLTLALTRTPLGAHTEAQKHICFYAYPKSTVCVQVAVGTDFPSISVVRTTVVSKVDESVSSHTAQSSVLFAVLQAPAQRRFQSISQVLW